MKSKIAKFVYQLKTATRDINFVSLEAAKNFKKKVAASKIKITYKLPIDEGHCITTETRKELELYKTTVKRNKINKISWFPSDMH